MAQFQIGIIADSFRKPLAESLKTARALGADGIQVFATGAQGHDILDIHVNREVSAQMTAQQKRDFTALVRDNGLVISALCGDFGRGFGDAQYNAIYVEKSKRVLDLALELNTQIVTTHIGLIPADANSAEYAVMQTACRELAEYGDAVGATFAVETGTEPAVRLKTFLDSLGAKGVRVNLDPANLWMCCEDDPVQAVYTLAEYIVHTHAKDGIPKPNATPPWEELPLGQGGVDFPRYLKALQAIGYTGFLTIEREVGNNPAEDIGMAVEFLKQTMLTL